MKFLYSKGNSLINVDFVKEIYVHTERDGSCKIIARLGGTERVISDKLSAQEASQKVEQLGKWLNGTAEMPEF